MQDCVILCGGKSSRMKQDKASLPFLGYKTMIGYQFQKYKKIFKNVYVSTKDLNADLAFPAIYDKFDYYSPMLALYSVLSKFRNKKVFIVPVDVPFLKYSTVQKLFLESANYDICVAKDNFGIHSLCGFFDSNIAKVVYDLYKSDQHAIRTLFKKVNFNSVFFDDDEQFFNINYLEDYQKAIKNHYD